MSDTNSTLTIHCHQCDFKWTSPRTDKGLEYLASTGSGHTLLYPGHVVTPEAPSHD